MSNQQSTNLALCNRSHSPVSTKAGSSDPFRLLKAHITARGDLPHVTVKRQLQIVDDLSSFPFGRFIVERRGANGSWTDYLLAHPTKGRLSCVNSEGKPFSPIEDFLLNRSPLVLATQERFKIFQELTQELLTDNARVASIPCGVMRDLLTLDYSKVSGYRLYGVDIDQSSIKLAAELATTQGVQNVEFLQEDAWNLSFEGQLDIINSNGLNVYEPDRKQVIELYRNFHRALRPEGVLICGVLTKPPFGGSTTDWDLSRVPASDLSLEQILHHDILEIKWRNFRSADDVTDDFEKAGFTRVQVRYDSRRIFPTVIAYK